MRVCNENTSDHLIATHFQIRMLIRRWPDDEACGIKENTELTLV